MTRSNWIFGGLGALGATLAAGAMAWAANADTRGAQSDTFVQLALFGEVLAKVEANYVVPTKDEELIKAAINGMLTSLDPHSSYLTPDEYTDLRVQVSGEYPGLGLEVTVEDGAVKVVSPIDGTPAARAGVKGGDYITHINGESILGVSLDDAVDRMRGPVGTAVTLSLVREGADPFDLTITRDRVVVIPVRWRVENNDIGYIRIASFNEKTVDGVVDAVRGLKKQGPMRGIVLDLRNNPGGILEQAVGVSDIFLDGGEVVSIRGRKANDIEPHYAGRKEEFAGVPIVVIVNEASASASEIVAGALQDRGRAKILGVTTFGKGSVQTVEPLSNGAQGALRLTTARYYTPSGRSIQGTGIAPDISVLAERVTGKKRLSYAERDLPHALKGESTAAKSSTPPEEPPVDFPASGDFQLKRALETVRTMPAPAVKKAKSS